MTIPAQDIVERLRLIADHCLFDPDDVRDVHKAADTISRLTADNEALREERDNFRDACELIARFGEKIAGHRNAATARADALAQEVEKLRLPEGTPMLVAGTEIIISFASVDDAHRAFDALEYAMSREPAALGDRP